MTGCPLCAWPIFLDPDDPHVLRCLLRFGIWARTIAGEPWRWWSRSE